MTDEPSSSPPADEPLGKQRSTPAPELEEVGKLVEASKKGDREAFDTLIGLFQNRVWSIAYRMSGNREDALEIAQEAFLKAYRYLGSFKSGSPFGPWITRITVHSSQDYLKKNRPPVRLVQIDEAPPPAVEGKGEAQVLEKEKRRVLFSLLDRLSERERTVFVLREIQGLPTREVAHALGIREATVRRHAGLARSRLLAILKEEYPELIGT